MVDQSGPCYLIGTAVNFFPVTIPLTVPVESTDHAPFETVKVPAFDSFTNGNGCHEMLGLLKAYSYGAVPKMPAPAGVNHPVIA
jgi:hypothetical protein